MKHLPTLMLLFGSLASCGGEDPASERPTLPALEVPAMLARLLGPEIAAALDGPSVRVRLLSLSPWDAEGDEDEVAKRGLLDKPRLHGYPILGGVDLEGEERHRVLAAVFRGIVEGGDRADCFRPRHGLIFEVAGRRRGLPICYECYGIVVVNGPTAFDWTPAYAGATRVTTGPGEPIDSLPTSRSSKSLLSSVLRRHGIPLTKD